MFGEAIVGYLPENQVQMTSKVSILVGVFNGERFLGELLDSIRAQTDSGWVCICVDDGSMDGSSAILAEAARRDARFHVLSQPNGGVGAARNAALAVVRTPYVMFADQDDRLAPDAVARAVSAIEALRADIVHFRSNRNLSQSIFVWEHIFRMSAIGTTRFPPITGGEDTAFFWELGFKGLQTAAIDAELYFNRPNRGSFSRAVSPRYIDNVFMGYQFMWSCGFHYGLRPWELRRRLSPHVFWFSLSVLLRHGSVANLKSLVRNVWSFCRNSESGATDKEARCVDK